VLEHDKGSTPKRPSSQGLSLRAAGHRLCGRKPPPVGCERLREGFSSKGGKKMLETIFFSIVILFLTIVIAVNFKRTTVFEYERGLRYSKGRFTGVLAPNRYFHSARTTIRKLDIRRRMVTVGGQEVLSADAVSIRISLLAQYEIVDASLAVNTVENFQEVLYSELQAGLRELVSALPIDEVIAQRRELGVQLFALCEKPVAEIGLKLLSLSVKDIMFPGEFKKIFSQVVQARQEGLAALEKARGETAALRSLANAAKMLEGNPALLQLKLLQAIGNSSGNTIVLDASPNGFNLPGRAKE
jgi:regulator of protease activity HflC (stomatin/prohibitin superfamily)